MNLSIASSLGLADSTSTSTAGNTVQSIYEGLRKRITTLQLIPDTTLSRTELTDMFQVSQTPIRDALQLLKQEGLVRIYPQSKTVVTRIEVAQIYEAHFLRIALETEVIRTLCSTADPAFIARLRSIIRMQEALADDPDQFTAFQELDELFHQTLFSGVGHTNLHRLIRSRSGHLERVRSLHLPERGKLASILEGHRAILDAIAEANAGRAVDAVRDHLSRTVAKLEELRDLYPGYFA